MSTDHAKFHYSATCKTDDPVVLACLRAICHVCEGARKAQIGWGGSGEDSWQSNDNQVTFRFTDKRYRQKFIDEAKRLLAGRGDLGGTDDNDPATPRRHA